MQHKLEEKKEQALVVIAISVATLVVVCLSLLATQ
jgi:hypothetical protein